MDSREDEKSNGNGFGMFWPTLTSLGAKKMCLHICDFENWILICYMCVAPETPKIWVFRNCFKILQNYFFILAFKNIFKQWEERASRTQRIPNCWKTFKFKYLTLFECNGLSKARFSSQINTSFYWLGHF
jgi:hypothetical protein